MIFYDLLLPTSIKGTPLNDCFTSIFKKEDKHVTNLLSHGSEKKQSGDRREDLYENKSLHFKSLISIKDNVTLKSKISFVVSIFVLPWSVSICIKVITKIVSYPLRIYC